MKYFCTLVFGIALFTNSLFAESKDSEKKGETISLSNGKVSLVAPVTWRKKQPRTRIVAYEFAAPSSDKKLADGRFTIMKAGGSVKANIDRWIGQFQQPDGSSTKDAAKVSEKKIKQQKLHLVDLSGTFNDRRGPFAPAVERKDYRMLGVIIPTEKAGQLFLKFYGPKDTVKKHEQAFMTMLDSLKVE